jgi:hypothetical protein
MQVSLNSGETHYQSWFFWISYAQRNLYFYASSFEMGVSLRNSQKRGLKKILTVIFSMIFE